MAEAMLSEDYRSSHENLKEYEGEHVKLESKNNHNNKKRKPTQKEDDDDSTNIKTTEGKAKVPQQSHCSNSLEEEDKNNEQKRVVEIQVPPKRRKISNACSFRTSDVVQGPLFDLKLLQQTRKNFSTAFSQIDYDHSFILISPNICITGLNKCMSEVERLDAIQMAISAFDHTDESLHNAEIEAGADIALVKMLVFLEFKTGFRRKPIKADLEAITREISLTLQALEMIYRASPESVLTSFNRVGTDLLHILVILVDEEVMTRVRAFSPQNSPDSGGSASSMEGKPAIDMAGQDDTNVQDGGINNRSVTPPPNYGNSWGVGNWDRDLMLRKASKILGHFARVGAATKPIAHFPGFLGSVLNLINMRPYDAVPWEARLSCLWTIANLACNSDNMVMMMCTPGLINSLVNVGFRQTEPSEQLERTMEILRARSIAARAIFNLSWQPENKIPMSSNIALVRVLCQLAIQRRAPYTNSNTIQEIMTQTRRHSIGAIRNMAAAPRRCKIGLCGYNNGKLLDILTDVALNDNDPRTIDLAFSAIHNLAVHDTAKNMVERPALVLALKNQLLAEEEEKAKGCVDDDEIRSHASATLLVLERSITSDMPQYENLRELLDAMNPSSQSDVDDVNVDKSAASEAVEASETVKEEETNAATEIINNATDITEV